jgi:hypothetical protein
MLTKSSGVVSPRLPVRRLVAATGLATLPVADLLAGEMDIFGKAWTPLRWKLAAAAQNTWSARIWSAVTWPGEPWR